MHNLADIIEDWILSKLSRERDEMIILKRNEMAVELECAPSQISYVLSTRFTMERGFFVESRRGLGGFIRIVRLPARHIRQEDMITEEESPASAEDVLAAIEHLQERNLLTAREAAIMRCFFMTLAGRIQPAERVKILRAALAAVAAAN